MQKTNTERQIFFDIVDVKSNMIPQPSRLLSTYRLTSQTDEISRNFKPQIYKTDHQDFLKHVCDIVLTL